jgi:AraC-like DNA-binding protein
LRAGEADTHIDVRFECAPSQGALKRTPADLSQHFRLDTLTGTVARTTTGSVYVPPGMNALFINMRGTLIARLSVHSRLVLVPPRSLTFVRGGTRLILQAARGEHESQVLAWQAGLAPFLEHWLNAKKDKASPTQRSLACKPIDPYFNEAYNRFVALLEGPAELTDPLTMSFLYEIVSRMMVGLDEVQLAAVPKDLPETIVELVRKVRGNPAGQWPLQAAASMAGYSPFHFSRVFKQLVGYGFHEYVDRCRTECAVDMLCTTDSSIDLVASACGFGTTQGLRESVREYLGLVPSELRVIPEPLDAQP